MEFQMKVQEPDHEEFLETPSFSQDERSFVARNYYDYADRAFVPLEYNEDKPCFLLET